MYPFVAAIKVLLIWAGNSIMYTFKAVLYISNCFKRIIYLALNVHWFTALLVYFTGYFVYIHLSYFKSLMIFCKASFDNSWFIRSAVKKSFEVLINLKWNCWYILRLGTKITIETTIECAILILTLLLQNYWACKVITLKWEVQTMSFHIFSILWPQWVIKLRFYRHLFFFETQSLPSNTRTYFCFCISFTIL